MAQQDWGDNHPTRLLFFKYSDIKKQPIGCLLCCVIHELQNTLKASGCYNDKIELAYFNAESIKLGYKPAEFTAMCMIAK